MSAASVWSDFGDTLGDRLADDLREMVRQHDQVVFMTLRDLVALITGERP